MALSDTWLRSNVGKVIEKSMEKTDRDGLSARVSVKGKIIFQMRFWHGGKQCRMDLGSYPAMSLKQARDDLIRFKADVEKGHDPRVTKKLIKQGNIDAITVTQLFYAWHKGYCEVNKKGHKEIKRSFELYLLPVLGALPVDRVTALMWCEVFEQRLKASESITERLLVNSKQMLNWGVRRGLCTDNVLQHIMPKADFNIVKHTCNRILTDDEIRMVWYALEHSRMAAKNKLFVKLCLMYACRNGELRQATKTDFDFDKMVWTIPASNHKAGKKSKKPLYRPITDNIKPFLLALFALSDGDFVLTNAGESTQFSINAGVSLPYHINQWLRKNANYEMQHWSLHDLRRTARTHFSALCQPHIAEIMLGHTLPGEWMTYDQYAYLDEQRAAYSAWVDKLMGIVNPL